MHSIFQKHKKFIIIYSIVVSVILLGLISLSLLGNIERTGYLSEFDKILDNYYNCKINYYNNKIFRHSDIYGVYPYFKNETENIFTAKDDNGTPFATLSSDNNELKPDDKIDIQYKLKLKKNVIILSILFLFIFPVLYLYIIPNIKRNYKYYILLLLINSSIYLLLPIILKQFSIMVIRYHYADILLSYIFLTIAFNLLNKKILYTLLFEIINILSFFVIQPLGLTFQNSILLFRDIPTLYPSLIAVSSFWIRILIILSSLIYFSVIILLIGLSIYNLLKMKKSTSIVMIVMIIIIIYGVFFRKGDVNIAWNNFANKANENGIIDTINYRINYDRSNNKRHSKNEVLNALNILKSQEEKRNYSNLKLQNNFDKRDIFIIFLESFYDYSHFTNLFDKDPFPKEYRDWANNSRKIGPNTGNGSFYARLAGLTGSSPLYQKNQPKNNLLEYTLPDLLSKNGYSTTALEEAINSYNLANFLPAIGFENIIFNIGTTNIDAYLSTNINNFDKPVFLYGFTLLGHTESHIKNDFNIIKNNNNFFSLIDKKNVYNLIETMDNSVITAMEIIKIRDIILDYSPNALIIFKHDHLYPYLRGIIENSSMDNDIKNSFLNDNTPNPILIWDGTNGAYKAPNNFVPENIPMFIAVNAGVTNYQNSVISLLYKEEIDGLISTYHQFYKITNDTLILENDISKDSEIYKYKKKKKILSQDIFQGKKHYYDLIEDLTNK